MVKNKLMKDNQLVEIVKSFSYKLNVGNYESRDFFCSQKLEVLKKDSDKVASELFEWCRAQVMSDVETYKKSQSTVQKLTPKSNRSNKEEKEQGLLDATIEAAGQAAFEEREEAESVQ